MRFIVIPLFLFFLFHKIQAQDFFNYQIHTKNEIKKYETELNSILTTIIDYKIHINPLDERDGTIKTVTLIFDRVKDDFIPRLHVWYHFDPDTTTLFGVEYNWGLYNPGFNANKNRSLLKRLSKKEKSFQKKFNSLYNEIYKDFGKETKNEIIADKSHVFIQTITWDLKDKIIKLNINFTRKLADYPGIGLAANFFHINQSIQFK